MPLWVILFLLPASLWADGCTLCVMGGKFPPGSEAHEVYFEALELLTARQARTLVEVSRDERSTQVFSVWAFYHEAMLYSLGDLTVDTEVAWGHLEARDQSLIAFLKSWHKPIDFLYLAHAELDESLMVLSWLHGESVLMLARDLLSYVAESSWVVAAENAEWVVLIQNR